MFSMQKLMPILGRMQNPYMNLCLPSSWDFQILRPYNDKRLTVLFFGIPIISSIDDTPGNFIDLIEFRFEYV